MNTKMQGKAKKVCKNLLKYDDVCLRFVYWTLTKVNMNICRNLWTRFMDIYGYEQSGECDILLIFSHIPSPVVTFYDGK